MKAVTKWPWVSEVPDAMNPMVGSLPAGCACNAKGHAAVAAPPSSVMKSRLFNR